MNVSEEDNMPVDIYIGRDFQEHTQVPNFSHEVRGVREVCRNLWECLHYGSSTLYAIIVNPQHTSTGRELSIDVVLASQFGLGMIELKHYYGNIDCRRPDSYWFAGPKPIAAGAKRPDEGGYMNPHQQVQDYAEQIRYDLIYSRGNWLPIGPKTHWEAFKFHTAVCFTHPNAQLGKKAKTDNYKPGQGEALKGWEKFSVLTPAGIPELAMELRFEVKRGAAYGHESYSWTRDEIAHLATKFFGARKWNGMISLMPVSKPYAYLTLLENERPTLLFGLYQNSVTIGRDPNTCSVLIPQRYEGVSREHARIIRSSTGIFIKDISKHGTYIGEQRVDTEFLNDGQRITLCPPTAIDKACVLKFSLSPPAPRQPPPPTTQ
jgi:hypothetical protein